MTYEWGYTYGPPMAVAPLNKVKEVVDYALTEIPGDKIYLGVPNYGYDWRLPFIRGESKAEKLTNAEAVLRATEYNAEILFDEKAAAPYYYYTDKEGYSHVVWFEDARSISKKLGLASSNGLYGLGYWNYMSYYAENQLVLNALYDIKKAF